MKNLEDDIRNSLWQLGIEDEQTVVDVLKERMEEYAKERQKELIEAATQLLARLDYHGSIDPIREEGPINDLKTIISQL